MLHSFPAAGAVVPPGPITLSLTFDQPMNCDWSVVFGGGGAEPCRPVIAWNLPDRRTWRMRCEVKPDAHYTIEFGGVKEHPFEALSGAEVAPFELAFSTLAASNPADAARTGELAPTATTGQLICGDQRRSQLDGCRVDRSGSDPFSSPR